MPGDRFHDIVEEGLSDNKDEDKNEGDFELPESSHKHVLLTFDGQKFSANMDIMSLWGYSEQVLKIPLTQEIASIFHVLLAEHLFLMVNLSLPIHKKTCIWCTCEKFLLLLFCWVTYWLERIGAIHDMTFGAEQFTNKCIEYECKDACDQSEAEQETSANQSRNELDIIDGAFDALAVVESVVQPDKKLEKVNEVLSSLNRAGVFDNPI
ncbi:hypothetical protein SERLA73DRAFT_149251 [Serpula lacrymans var. lacrymans S7.3]|uniref:Uncharacterized protein n=2 Tax=Serpula lacrymans var. lacrymans TaxID=341189 RepID=F8PH40_SERL3|nr:uncharacterized protein SERLADRAFT_404776 [Serpula lacrymans var. lacrymans S7.9]EGO04936.1 hypothetical protein SERLA73DRAFT_149251 [Serpula lacrymans var. lacrymans S7.3]EGO30738.1 hypothetical protein SERLADRAFT_404776 [Serpula lacrymans var. lacrymans S7.9]